MGGGGGSWQACTLDRLVQELLDLVDIVRVPCLGPLEYVIHSDEVLLESAPAFGQRLAYVGLYVQHVENVVSVSERNRRSRPVNSHYRAAVAVSHEYLISGFLCAQ